MDRQQYIAETVRLLKQHYGATKEELLEAFHESPTIPVTAFYQELTPLQAITHYLSTHKKTSTSTIAKILARPKSTIEAAKKQAEQKSAPTTPPQPTPYNIKLSTLKQHNFTPGEAVIYDLHTQYGLDNKTIAELLQRDPRNTHTLLTKAIQKAGGNP